MKKGLSLLVALFVSISSCQAPLEEAQPTEIVCPDAEFGKPMRRHCQSLEERGTPPAFARLNQVLASNAVRAGNPPSAQLKWGFAGPNPIEDFTNNPGVPVSGRMLSIAIDPKNGDHWFAGSAAGGIFETTDAGQSWAPVDNSLDLPLLGVGAIAIHPQSPNLIYAGTGEPDSDAYGGLGIFRSEDGGRTWNLFSDVPFSGSAVADIVLNPSDPNLVLLGSVTTSNLPVARKLKGSVGIFRSNDRGKTWTSVLAHGDISDLEVNSKNAAQIYAGSPGDVTTVWRTFDNGQSWQQVDGPWKNIGRSGIVLLASSPTNPDVLYVSIGDASLKGLWKSVNAWSDQPSFTQINTEATGPSGYCDNQCSFANAIAVSAVDENVLYAGGDSLWRYVGGAPLPWEKIGLAWFGPIHADQHFILPLVEKDGSNLVDGLLVANDGGIFRWNKNGSSKWDSLQNGLTVTQFYSGAISLDGNKIVGGSQDNGSSIDIDEPTLDTDWTSALGGDGFDAVLGKPILVNDTTVDSGKWILTTQYGTVHRSLNGGASFRRFEQSPRGPFATRVAQCSSNSDVNIVGAVGGVMKTDDFFSTTPPTWIKQSSGSNSSSWTRAVAFLTSDDTCKTYAYSSWETVFVTLDGGATWLTQYIGGSVSDIQFIPSAIGGFPRLYVTISQFGRSHVIRITCSKNGWDLRDDLRFPADIPVNGMDVDEASDTFFAATDNGVWMLPNASRCPSESCQWTHFGPDQGFPHVITYGISIAPLGRKVAAFTHGRGAFVMDISSLKSTPPTNKICEFARDVCDQYTGWRDRSEQCWNVKVNNIQMCAWRSFLFGGTCSRMYYSDDPCNLAADRQDTQCGAGDFASCVLKDIGT